MRSTQTIAIESELKRILGRDVVIFDDTQGADRYEIQSVDIEIDWTDDELASFGITRAQVEFPRYRLGECLNCDDPECHNIAGDFYPSPTSDSDVVYAIHTHIGIRSKEWREGAPRDVAQALADYIIRHESTLAE